MSHPYVYNAVVMNELPNLTGKIVIDVGCGKGVRGYLMRSEKKGDETYIIGLDLSRKYLKFCKRYRVYDEVILSDASHMPIRGGRIDLLLASEVIGHMPKKKGGNVS